MMNEQVFTRVHMLATATPLIYSIKISYCIQNDIAYLSMYSQLASELAVRFPFNSSTSQGVGHPRANLLARMSTVTTAMHTYLGLPILIDTILFWLLKLLVA